MKFLSVCILLLTFSCGIHKDPMKSDCENLESATKFIDSFARKKMGRRFDIYTPSPEENEEYFFIFYSVKRDSIDPMIKYGTDAVFKLSKESCEISEGL